MKGGIWLVFLAALVASIYGTALGAEVSINSDTYLKYFEDTSGNSYMPLYEYLSLSAGSSTGEGVSFHLGGYLSQDIDNTLYEKQTDTNLQYGYIGYLNKGAGIHIQLGRLYVMEGLSPGQIDGLTGKKTFGPLGVGLFVGDPVEDPDATVKADLTFGGRVNLTGASYDIGLSYLKTQDGGTDLEEATGVDFVVTPSYVLSFYGSAEYEMVDGGLGQVHTALRIGPYGNLVFSPEVTWQDYRHLFVYSTEPQLFSQIDPQEKVLQWGTSVEYLAGENLTVTGELKKLDYDIKDSAMLYGAGLRFIGPEGSSSAGLSLDRLQGGSDKDKYTFLRAYGSMSLWRLLLACDLSMTSYDKAIYGVKTSYSVTGTIGAVVSRMVTVSADAQYSKNPYYDKEYRYLAKVKIRI